MYNTIFFVHFWQQQLQSISVSLYSPSAPQNIQIFALELSYILISAFKCLQIQFAPPVRRIPWSGTFCGTAQFNKNHTKIYDKCGWSPAL